MRLLFTSFPGYGHVHPMLPLARAARRAGHEVRFATGPDLVERVRGYGFDARAVGLTAAEINDRYNAAYDDTDDLPPHERLPKVVPRLFVDIGARASLPDVLALAEEWRPDLIVSEQSESAGPIVATVRGIRGVVHGWGPRVPRALVDVVVPAIEALAHEHFPGTPVDPAAFPYIDICPESLHLEPDPVWDVVLPLRHEDPPTDGATIDLPDDLVYVTLGTVVNDHEGVFEAVLEALAGETILVTVGPDADPARLAGYDVIVERFVPQGLVFPHCRAVVAHAGAGTMLGALAAGLPQVLLPAGAEQFLNAAACAAAGAAEVTTPDGVRDAFARLGDSHVAAARRLAGEIAAMPSADETLKALL